MAEKKKPLEEIKKQILGKGIKTGGKLLLLNPSTMPFVAVAIILLIFLTMTFGGFAINDIIGNFKNFIFLGAGLALVGVFKISDRNIIMFSILLSLMFTGYQIAQEIGSMQKTCSIPFIGWLMCFFIAPVKFITWAWILLIKFISSFILIYVLAFIKKEFIGE